MARRSVVNSFGMGHGPCPASDCNVRSFSSRNALRAKNARRNGRNRSGTTRSSHDSLSDPFVQVTCFENSKQRNLRQKDRRPRMGYYPNVSAGAFCTNTWFICASELNSASSLLESPFRNQILPHHLANQRWSRSAVQSFASERCHAVFACVWRAMRRRSSNR